MGPETQPLRAAGHARAAAAGAESRAGMDRAQWAFRFADRRMIDAVLRSGVDQKLRCFRREAGVLHGRLRIDPAVDLAAEADRQGGAARDRSVEHAALFSWVG